MMEYVAEKRTKASADKIWNIWTNVAEWNHWDNDVKSSDLFGNFEKGTYGILYPKKGPKTKFFLSEVIRNKRFITTSKLPLTKIDFIHEINDSNDKRTITHKIRVSGPLSKLFNILFVKELSHELSKSVSNLIEIAEDEKF